MKNKVPMLLLSLFISFGLWLYVISVVSPDSEVSISGVPVQIQGEKFLLEQSNLMIVDISASNVSLVLNGNRSDLNKLDSRNITITMDVSKIDRAGRHPVTYDVVLPGDVPSNAVSVQTRDPDRLYIQVENRVRNPEVPLRVSYDKSLLPGGYKLRETGVEYPDYITVSGPESIMDEIAYAKVDIDLTGRQESYDNTPVAYKLYDSQNKEIESDLLTHDGTVPLTMPINYTKELPLKLQLKDGGGATATDAQVRFFVPKAADDTDKEGEDKEITSISVSGSKHILDGETALTLDSVDLATISDKTKLTFKLDELPLLKEEGINNETSFNEIYAIITFPKLEEREFSDVMVYTENIGDGLSAPEVLGRIDVVVRGPMNLVEQLQRSDFRVIVDLAGVTASEEEHPVKIVFEPGYEKLGAMLSQKGFVVKVILLPEDDS